MVTVAEIMNPDFFQLDAQATVVEAIGKLQESDERFAIITDKRFKPSYRGVLDRASLIESKLDPNAHVGLFLAHPPIVASNTDAYKAAELLYHSYPSLLPVQKKDKIIGVVRPQDVIALLLKAPVLAKLKASDIATRDMVLFAESARLGDAINRMKEKHFQHAPIVDKSGKIISVFSLTDLMQKYFLKPEGKVKSSGRSRGEAASKFTPRGYSPIRTRILDTNIGDAASATVFTVSPSTLLGQAAKEMLDNGISDVIVAQDRRPVGIITFRDLLKAFSETKAPEYWGVQFFGCEQLPGILYNTVREQVSELYEKMQRAYFPGKIVYFLVHIKKYEKKEHGKEKFSVHLRLAIPARVFNADYAHFHLNTAVSWALKALEQEVLKFKEKGKKSWTVTGKKGKRIEFGRARKRAIEKEGKVLRPKLVKRK